MKHYSLIKACRVCGSKKLAPVVRIKPQFIASTFVKSNKDNPKSNIKIPMTALLCDKCGLVQLKETVEPDLLYEQYFYRSHVTKTMSRDLKTVVEDALSRITVKKGDAVLDIGCNDGTMISMFPDTLTRVGIDPAKNIDWSHLDKNITVVNDYFPTDTLKKWKFKAITSTAMFYDLNDPNKAVRDIKEILADDGVLCIQVSYLYDTIKDMNFYDFCHEHLEYYSLKSIMYLMEKNGMRVFDASTNAVNGGSLRILAAKKEAKRDVSDSVEYLLLREKALHLEDPETYDIFEKLIAYTTTRVREYIGKQKGLTIGLGASTKGNVLLQMCGITKKMLPYISERNPEKVGLRTLGDDIELISEERARELKPSCVFVIPWNFKSEIVEREREYLASGGKFLFIMPYPYVLTRDGETRL
ncbi:MAG: class I SAM-dependent methyltransferase [Candidatus Gottesmanbacteria bacterium]|nr:class I SAM-dependent methyltransferase [Candidatus Gottesmanbacteria bacterium]